MKQRSSTSNSDKNRKYLTKYLLFLILLFALYLTACAVVDSLANKYDARNPTQRITQYQMEDFYALPENSLELLILGSSHAMCTFDPLMIEERNNLKAFNLGTALQQPDTGYYLLKESLKTQKPKCLLFELYFKVMQNDKSAEQAITVLKEMRPSLNKLWFLLGNLGFEAQADYLSGWFNPFGRLYSILADIESNNDVPKRSEFYRGGGFYVSTATVKPEALKPESHPFPAEFEEFTTRQIKYVTKLAELARKNNIEVIFVTAPLPPSILSNIEYYDEITAACEKLADNLNVEYIDFNIAMKAEHLKLSDTDFADQGHLNRTGAVKFGEYFTDILPDILR